MAVFIMNVVGSIVLINFVVICVVGVEGNKREGVSEKVNPLVNPIPRERGGVPGERVKRYPQHLDPTLLKFWIQVGECPESPDGVKQYYCPSLNSAGKQVCIDDYQLCNGAKECPNAEDENKHYCLFYKALKSQVELLERSLATLNSAPQKNPVRRYANTFYHTYDYK